MNGAAWYAARGTGVIALVLLTVVMVLGVGSRSGRPIFGLPRFGVSLVHRNASLLAIVLIGVHVISLLIDPYAHLHLLDIAVPFGASYRTLWVGLGAVAFDLVLALIVTSLLRHRMRAAAWRAVHWLAYAAWPVAWWHGIGAGTDRHSGWYLATAVVSGVMVLIVVIWRVAGGFATQGGRRARRVSETLSLPTPTTTTYAGKR